MRDEEAGKDVEVDVDDMLSDCSETEAFWIERKWTLGFASSMEQEYRCIYRVPYIIFSGQPEAYKPMMLLMGPFHHCIKAEAKAKAKTISMDLDTTNARYMGYLKMEQHKEIYLKGFTRRVGRDTIQQLKRSIREEEEKIRASYAESTHYIEAPEFIDMVLHDSVFILELILRHHENDERSGKTGDVLMDNPSSQNALRRDLMMLENQLPYFILEKLFDLAVERLPLEQRSLRELILTFFGAKGQIKENTKFRHFTDMARCTLVESLDYLTPEEKNARKPPVLKMYNADKLDSAGVKFQVMPHPSGGLSLKIKFEKGCLKLPPFVANDGIIVVLRNIMALEQCHYNYATYVCSYCLFLNRLIDNDKDVELLAQQGILANTLGHDGTVAEVVNKLTYGIVEHSSYYYDIADALIKHYNNPLNRSRAKLRRVYFTDLWTGTATVAATILLLLTLIQTVASVIQVLHK